MQLLHHLAHRPSSSGGALIAYVLVVFAADSAIATRAQEARIEDVRVGAESSARREDTTLRETPRSVGFVDSKKAEEQHLERLSDFSQLVPNYRPNESNPIASRPAIRGVGSTVGQLSRGSINAVGAEFDTGYILDNIFWKYAGFQAGDLVDISSFELALGPQGTAGGKNTTVGNVVVSTQRPSFERQATIETSFASYSRIIEKLNVTGPIIDDKLAYRVTAYFDKGDGWIRDQVTGASYLNNDRWGVRGQLLYVGDDVTDRLIFSAGAQHEYTAIGAFTTGPVGDTSLIYANGTLPARSYAQNVAARLGKRILTFDPYRPYDTNAGGFGERHLMVSNELSWTLGRHTLTSLTAFGNSRVIGNNPFGNQELETSVGVFAPYVDQFSQEIRLSSPKEDRLEWTTGLFSLYENAWSRTYTRFGADAAAWYSRPALLRGLQNNRDSKSRTFSVAGYGQGTYHIDDAWALTFGVRDSYEVKEGSVFSWDQLYANQYTFAQQEAAIRAGGGQALFDTGGQSKTFNSVTGIFNPQYKFDDHLLFHALVARGEKSGAINNSAQPILDSALNFKGWQPLVTKPETSWDYELGVNTSWLDDRLIANFNVYWNDIYNFQTSLTDASYTDSTGQPIRTSYLGNVGHLRLRGFEFVGRWSPVERLWLSFNGAYTEARWIDYANATPPTDWIWPTTAGSLSAPLTLSRSNTRWENLPLWSFNVGATYDQPLGPLLRGFGPEWDRSITGFGYVNLAWQDKTQLTDPHSVLQYWQPPFAIVNAGLGLRTDDEQYSLSIWAKNVFDERPLYSWSPGDASNPTTIGLPSQPRVFGGTLRVKLL
ncbi:TonB-dependent receptor [Methylosinus sp. LW4]|uniref:TonB-dependent receptor n=1 Tax=Methylosinus sp. LW4 TaxID=136993 RepID=UPI00035DB52B|nr:TonB-dependent receptor [Methylosinus sp. LW4]